MNTLYLHIGMPKTGTSTLQKFLSSNAATLKADGIYYPNVDGIFRLEEKQRDFHGNGDFLGEYALDLETVPAERQQYLKDLWAELKKEGQDVLLSSEDLFEAPHKLYSNLLTLGGFQLKLIIFLRRQDLWAESWWNQQVKTGVMAEDCYTYAQSLDLDYEKKIKDLADIVGEENIILQVYASGRDLIGDFMGLLGVTELGAYVRDRYHANPSLSATQVELQRLINAIPDHEVLMETLRLKLTPTFSAMGDKPSSAPRFLSSDQRQALWSKYQAGNCSLASRFAISGASDTLFAPPGPDEEATVVDCEAMCRQVVGFLGTLLVDQQKRMNAMEQKLYAFVIPQKVTGKVIVYGLDRFGCDLYHQIKEEKCFTQVTPVDRKWKERSEELKIAVESPTAVDFSAYDYILIALADYNNYQSVKAYLETELKVDADKILRIER